MQERILSVAHGSERTRPHIVSVGELWGQRGRAGGLDRVFTDLLGALPGQGLRVSGLVRGPVDVETLSGGRVRPFTAADVSKLSRYLGARRALAQILSRDRVDLVACHFALYSSLSLDRLRHVPLVMHFHGPWSSEAAEEGERRAVVLAKAAVERLSYRRADRIIVLSRAFGELAVRQFGVRPDRIRIVPGHVDLDRFAVAETKAQARARLGWPADRPILLTVRRLWHRMGVDRLVAAMSSIVRDCPDTLLHIGGTGPLRPALERQVDELGLRDHVRFLGFVPDEDLPSTYRAADINVVPTVALEGFGLVAAEALAAGTPSMVSPVGGLPEVVGPLSKQLIFRSCDVENIAAGLTNAIRGTIDMPTAQACRAYAHSVFALDRAAAGVASVYRELLSQLPEDRRR